MKKLKITIIAALAIISAYAVAFSENVLPGRTGRWVNDYAKVIDADTAQYLEKRISSIRQTTPDPVEIIIATFGTISPMSIEDFTLEYGEKWRGVKKGRRDNGVVMILALKERRVMIGVGKNLNSVLTPQDTARIINDIISPYMARGEYSMGMKKGAEAVIDKLENAGIPMGPSVTITRILLIIFICFMLLRLIRRNK